jgi:hypothetical protein
MRKVSLQHKLQHTFVNALLRDFRHHGQDAIEKVREHAPVRYLQIISSFLPKEATLNVNQSGTVRHEVPSLEATAKFLSDLAGNVRARSEESVIDVTPEDVEDTEDEDDATDETN